MKFLKLNNYSFLCLESESDFLKFVALSEQTKSKQSAYFWFGFKKHNLRKTPIDYAQHELKAGNSIAYALTLKLEYKNSETSIVDYAKMADTMINELHAAMSRIIERGKFVRINTRGGYCDIDSFENYDEVRDINEQEMYSFLLSGEINSEFKINRSTVVIENDSYIPAKLVDSFCNATKMNKNDIQIITSFKSKSLLFNDSDFINFFEHGFVNCNLANIVFETTAQDSNQILSIKAILESCMKKRLNKQLNVFVMTYGESSKLLFNTILPNIKITFLK